MVEKHNGMIPSLVAAHSLSGCDTVLKMFGIGKGKAFSVVKRCPLNFLGRADSLKNRFVLIHFEGVDSCRYYFCEFYLFSNIHKNVYQENQASLHEY